MEVITFFKSMFYYLIASLVFIEDDTCSFKNVLQDVRNPIHLTLNNEGKEAFVRTANRWRANLL